MFLLIAKQFSKLTSGEKRGNETTESGKLRQRQVKTCAKITSLCYSKFDKWFLNFCTVFHKNEWLLNIKTMCILHINIQTSAKEWTHMQIATYYIFIFLNYLAGGQLNPSTKFICLQASFVGVNIYYDPGIPLFLCCIQDLLYSKVMQHKWALKITFCLQNL